MKYVLLYTLESREKFGLDAVKEEIRTYDADATINIMFFYDILSFGLENKIDVILCPPIVDDCSAMVITMIKLQHKCKIVCLSTEGLRDFNDEENVDPRMGLWLISDKLIDYFFFWGSRPVTVLGNRMLKRKSISSADRIGISGYILYDHTLYKREQLDSSIEESLCSFKKKYDKCILFLTGFGFTNHPVEDAKVYGMLSKENSCSTEQRLIEEYTNKINYAKKYLKLIDYIAGIDTNIGIIVKLHPTEIGYVNPELAELYDPIKKRSNVLYIDESLPVALFLDKVDMLFHYGSTVGLEAYKWNVPTVILTGNKNYVEIYPSTYSVDVCNTDEIVRIIEKAEFRENAEVEKELDELFDYRKGEIYHPAKIIAKELFEGSKTQPLDKHDSIVKTVLSYERPQCYKGYYLIDVLSHLKHIQKKGFKDSIVNLMRIEPNLLWCIRDYYVWIKSSLKEKYKQKQ